MFSGKGGLCTFSCFQGLRESLRRNSDSGSDANNPPAGLARTATIVAIFENQISETEDEIGLLLSQIATMNQRVEYLRRTKTDIEVNICYHSFHNIFYLVLYLVPFRTCVWVCVCSVC